MHQRISLQATVFRLIAVGIYFAFFSVQLSCQFHIALQQTRFPHTVVSSAKNRPDVVRGTTNDKEGFKIRLNKRYQPESFMELAAGAPALVPVYRVLEKQPVPFIPHFTNTCLSLRLQRGPPSVC